MRGRLRDGEENRRDRCFAVDERRGRERVASSRARRVANRKDPSVVEEQSHTGAIGERSQCKKRLIDTRYKIDHSIRKMISFFSQKNLFLFFKKDLEILKYNEI